MWVRALLIVCLVCLPLSVEATTYYVDFTLGDDTRNSTQAQSKSTPWKHVKGMTGATSNASTVTVNDGDIFVFKGGETWTSSYPWTLQHGTAAMVTYTTDHTWYTGGAWSQPTFDDASANPGAAGMIALSSAGYVTLNDMKFLACGVLNFADVTNKCLVFTNTHDITITNSTFRTYSWISIYMVFTVAGSYSNFTLTGNDIANTSAFLWFASAAANTTMHALTMTTNVVHDLSSQLGGRTPAGNNPHGNAFLHYFSVSASDATQYLDGLVFCNNRTYGDFRNTKDVPGNPGYGIAMTAMYFTEGSVSGLLCNNDFSFTPVAASTFNSLMDISGVGNTRAGTLEIYNNTLVQNGTSAMSAAIGVTNHPALTLISKNNIISGMQYAMYFHSTLPLSFTSNYNLIKSNSGQSEYGTGLFKSYAQWQALGFDANGILGSDPLLVSIPDNQHLQPTSPAVGVATNLTSLGYTILNSDRDSVARGSTWDIGAYMQQGGSGAPAAPSSVRVAKSTGTLVTLIWAPNTESDLAGYRVYRGTTTGQTNTLVKDITATTAAAAHKSITSLIQQLPIAATYYYTVTAYNTNAQESVKSSEVSTVSTGNSRTAATGRGGH